MGEVTHGPPEYLDSRFRCRRATAGNARPNARSVSYADFPLSRRSQITSFGSLAGVVIAGNLSIHGLVTHFEHATEATSDRYGPLLTRCSEQNFRAQQSPHAVSSKLRTLRISAAPQGCACAERAPIDFPRRLSFAPGFALDAEDRDLRSDAK
jgi:hypothetical protein